MDNSLIQINEILVKYNKKINDDMNSAMKDGAKKAAKYLKQESPKDKGAYAKSWKWKAEKYKTSGYRVYNEKHYQLTHLLEYGHDVVVNGKKVGHAKAYPHIKAVEERINKEIIDDLEGRLNQ